MKAQTADLTQETGVPEHGKGSPGGPLTKGSNAFAKRLTEAEEKSPTMRRLRVAVLFRSALAPLLPLIAILETFILQTIETVQSFVPKGTSSEASAVPHERDTFVARACAMWSRLHSTPHPVSFEALQKGLADVYDKMTSETDNLAHIATKGPSCFSMNEKVIILLGKTLQFIADKQYALLHHIFDKKATTTASSTRHVDPVENGNAVIEEEGSQYYDNPGRYCLLQLCRLLFFPILASWKLTVVALTVMRMFLMWALAVASSGVIAVASLGATMCQRTCTFIGAEGVYNWVASFMEALKEDVQNFSDKSIGAVSKNPVPELKAKSVPAVRVVVLFAKYYAEQGWEALPPSCRSVLSWCFFRCIACIKVLTGESTFEAYLDKAKQLFAEEIEEKNAGERLALQNAGERQNL